MIQMAAVFGELELAMTKERINAGLARARAQGKVLGRPIKRDKHRRKVLAERAKEKGIRKIARELSASGQLSESSAMQPSGENLTLESGSNPGRRPPSGRPSGYLVRG